MKEGGHYKDISKNTETLFFAVVDRERYVFCVTNVAVIIIP